MLTTMTENNWVLLWEKAFKEDTRNKIGEIRHEEDQIQS